MAPVDAWNKISDQRAPTRHIFGFLLAIVSLTTSPPLLAGRAAIAAEPATENSAPHDYGYDYDAVCDFIMAREHEAELAVKESPESDISKRPTIKESHAFRLERNGLRADYEVIRSSIWLTDIHFQAPGFAYETARQHLYQRLSIKADVKAPVVTMSCDTQDLTLTFKDDKLVDLHLVATCID